LPTELFAQTQLVWFLPSSERVLLFCSRRLLRKTASGITSFHHAGKDLAALHQKLLEANIFTSLRVDRTGKKYIRLSPHFYNTDEELQRVMELI